MGGGAHGSPLAKPPERMELAPVDSDAKCNPVDSIWFLNEKSGFPSRTPAFCSVSRGQRRLGEKEYRAPSVTPRVALRPRTQASPSEPASFSEPNQKSRLR